MTNADKKQMQQTTKETTEARLVKDPKGLKEMAQVGKDILKGAAAGAVKGAVIGAIAGAMAEANKSLEQSAAAAAGHAAKSEPEGKPRNRQSISGKETTKKQQDSSTPAAKRATGTSKSSRNARR